MRRYVLIPTAAVLLLTAGFAGCPDREMISAPAPTMSSEAQQRFLIDYCYAQYRGQSDIARCLGRPV